MVNLRLAYSTTVRVTYEIPAEESFTVIHAIAMAGGFTAKARQTNVKITRVVAGEKKAIEVDVKAMIRDTRTPPFDVQPGDTINVFESAL